MIDELTALMRESIRGEVRADLEHRILYATDASLYQQEPRAVVLPRDAEDVQAVLETAAEASALVLPRGAGTSLAGQTTCEGALVLDFSRHMDAVLEIDSEARTARIQPGVVLDRLNAAASKHGLMFGPDVAPSNRATVGGMAGNNSCGAHSLRYGLTADNVREARIFLADGTTLDLRSVAREEAEARARRSGAEGRVFATLLELVDEHADEIRERMPSLHRRVSGYNLDALLPAAEGGELDLGRLFVGSEGTLATGVELTVDLVERPPARGLAVVRFPGLLEALRATDRIKEANPAAVEVLDDWLLGLALDSPGYREGLAFLEDDRPGAVLLVELFGDEEAEVTSRLEALERELESEGVGEGVDLALSAADQALVWKARKAGLGLLMSMKGDAKPVAFVEDTAVPPERLPDYMEEFLELVREEDVRCAVYGHAAAGCLHTRPILAVKDPRDREKLVRISEGIAELVRRHGGCLSGEHGDGLSRSRYLEATFGPRLTAAFRKLKGAFDPDGRMNPGKITAAPRIDERLRQGPGYEPRVPETAFRFAAEGGMDRAVELCNGMAVCRKRGEGAMCPSFMAVREEEHSTRGRANLLRAALDGRLPGGLASEGLHEALSLCLECKACKTECPTQVDMARLKSEALFQRRGGGRASLDDALLGRIDRHARRAARFGPLLALGRLAHTTPARWLLERLAGIDRRRRAPLPVGSFRRRWRPEAAREDGRPQVALFVDTFSDFFEPEVARAAVDLLERAGYRVLDAGLGCCGRTRISRGLLDEARELARANQAGLRRWKERGIPVVGLEPSCVFAFRDDHQDLLEDPDGEALENVLLPGELFERDGIELALPSRKILLHTHCHQRALVGPDPTMKLLQAAGAEVTESAAGCCGMAGSFGFQHYEVSLAVARDRLVPAVEAAGEDTLIVAPGTSCRQQIAHTTGREALHPVQALIAQSHQRKT